MATGHPKRLAILGSTGSIGTMALEVAERHPDKLEVVGLAAAGGRLELLAAQVERFQPRVVAVSDDQAAKRLAVLLSGRAGAGTCEIWSGPEALAKLASLAEVDQVLVAVVGAAGLKPTLAAAKAGKAIALANKEALVAAGHLVMSEVREHGAELVPVDSEHSAIYQCLGGLKNPHLRRLILTGSGGPFRKRPKEELGQVSVAEALAHPNWRMGSKITIDSATLMNKGLEVIEARWLFDASFEQIEVVIHPQSIVHSLVEFVDGSVLAQLGWPDMRLPIQFALSAPMRWQSAPRPLSLVEAGRLEFETVDEAKFPSLRYAYEAGRIGWTMPSVLNAANEVAVAAFLAEEIPFPAIPAIVHDVMERHQVCKESSLEAVLAADSWARSEARRMVRRCKP